MTFIDMIQINKFVVQIYSDSDWDAEKDKLV